MRGTELGASLSLLLLLIGAPLAQADSGEPGSEGDDTNQRIEALERRINELEAEEDEPYEGTEAAEDESRSWPWSNRKGWGWTDYIRLSGSASVGYYDGMQWGPWANDGFRVFDARFFIDAELGSEAKLFGRTIVRNAGFSFEWDLVRIGSLQNQVGQLYVDLQGIANSDWLNLQVGRFQLPIGEAYLRYSKGARDNPFISNPAGGTWYWDEGIKLYGGRQDGLFAYVASLTDGETAFNNDLSPQKQYTLKLITEPGHGLRFSVSGLYQGNVGSDANPGAGGSLWLGEMWARALGSNFGPPASSVRGNGPNRLSRTWYVGGDAILDRPDQFRLWLGYGFYKIDRGSTTFDTDLQSWVAELVIYGSLFAGPLRPFYIGIRSSGVGSFNASQGDLLDQRYANTLGYNASQLIDTSFVIGWNVFKHVRMRAEYTLRDVKLVPGVDAATLARGGRHDYGGVELGIYF